MFASQSGIYVKKNHIEIGEKIEIKPELENQEHLKVRDTAPISSIGTIMAGIQEIKENWEEIHKPHHHDIIIDAEHVEVVQEHKEEKKSVIATDADPKTPDSQAIKEPDYTIHEQEARQLLDEIYYEDIAPYREFERVQSPTFLRPGSPVSELDYFGIAQNFVKAVVESAVEFDAELVTPGGVENYQKFKAGKISALEYTNLVAQDMAKDATAAAIGAQIGGELVGAAAKYAIGNCRGKGADLIREILFPEGQPEGFDEYLKVSK